MTVNQRFQPPFAIDDVDSVALDFSPAMELSGVEALVNPSIAVTGGFTVGDIKVGDVNVDGLFIESPTGTYVWVMLTATEVGHWEITFTVDTTGGRTLNRTERIDVAAARS